MTRQFNTNASKTIMLPIGSNEQIIAYPQCLHLLSHKLDDSRTELWWRKRCNEQTVRFVHHTVNASAVGGGIGIICKDDVRTSGY